MKIALDSLRSATKGEEGPNPIGWIAAYRQLVTRLYEAYKPIRALDDNQELEDFAMRGDEKAGWMDALRSAYARSADRKSLVEELFADIRHSTVHYDLVGSKEMRETLDRAWGMPATIGLSPGEQSGKGAKPNVTYRWVHAISSAEFFGEYGEDGWTARYEERTRVAASIAQRFMLVANVLILVQANRRGIDSERLIQIDD